MKSSTRPNIHTLSRYVSVCNCTSGHTRTDDSQWVEMKDLEFHPVTLCSRWRSGQARPGLSQERKSERERWEESRWGRCRKEGRGGQSCFFNFFFIYVNTRVCFLFCSLLVCLRCSSLLLSSPLPLFSPSFSLLPSWGYTWAQPWRPRPQLTRCREEGSRGQRKEKVRVEGMRKCSEAAGESASESGYAFSCYFTR